MFSSKCLVTQSCLTLCDPMDWSLPGSYVHRDSPGKNTGVGSFSLVQGIFPTQGSNPGLPHCRQILYQPSHQGSPRILEWVAYPFSRGSSRPRNQTGISCIGGCFFTSWVTRQANSLFEKFGLSSTSPLSKCRAHPSTQNVPLCSFPVSYRPTLMTLKATTVQLPSSQMSFACSRVSIKWTLPECVTCVHDSHSTFLRCFHVIAPIHDFYCWVVFHCMNIPHLFISLPVDGHILFFWLL